MKKTVIFSGTTEGRLISAKLSEEGIKHYVCVASEYGKDVMDDDENVSVHVGRMDKEEICSYLQGLADKEGVMLVDATHPYATEVTENLKYAADRIGAAYIRVVRSGSDISRDKFADYADMDECARSLNGTEGNILITTGSKELGKYRSIVSADTLGRTYVRVLPALESIKLCEDAGIDAKHIIAMHGPFTLEMNEALIRQYDIKHLVSKDSGTAGGFEEKVKAAENTGAMLHVISRPAEEEGVTYDRAFELISGKKTEYLPEITLAGIGMGDKGSMTLAACRAVKDSDILFGAARLIRDIYHPHKYEMYKADDIKKVLEKEKPKKAAVVFSGDSGFYSGAAGLSAALKEWKPEAEISILPGISSFSYLSAKCGVSYEDAALFSLHGKSNEEGYAALIKKVGENKKTFALLSGGKDIPEIAERLKESAPGCRIIIGEDLSYEDEKTEELTPGEAAGYKSDGMVCVMIMNPEASGKDGVRFIADEDFLRSDIPMTKECVRHESVIRLKIKKEDVVFDIGGGTGSVAIEAAAFCPEARVYTIEKKKEAAELIRKNMERFDVSNLRLVEGKASEVLGELETPDCVFIGGSGGELSEIIRILGEKRSGIRYVINAVSVETVEAVHRIIKENEVSDERITLLNVSEAKKAGDNHLMLAQNPVWIFSFVL